MNKKNRYCFCATMLLAAVLISCAAEGAMNTETTAALTQAETEAVDNHNPRYDVPSSLDLKALDFGGETVTVLTRSESPYYEEYYAEKENGDIVNDAVFRRNRQTEEKLNIDLGIIAREGSWGPHTQFITQVKGEIMAGMTEYDFISYYAYCMPQLSSQGLFTNLYDVEHINTEKPWWHSMYIENAELYGNLYTLVGDISLSAVSDIFCLFFNKTLAQNYLDVDPYEMVNNGTWTLDRFLSLVKDIYADLDGDGQKTAGDFFGWDATDAYDALPAACAVTFSQSDGNGGYVLNMNTERNADILTRYEDACNEPGVYWILPAEADKTFFINRHALFYSKYLDYTKMFRDMEDDYGLLPHPKYDDAQESYYSVLSDAYSQIAIPTTCEHTEIVGATLELLAELSYKDVIPAYFETAMKDKYLRDNESAKMFDILVGNVWYDFEVINTSMLGDPVMVFRDVIFFDKNFASYMKSKERFLEKNLSSFLMKMQEVSE